MIAESRRLRGRAILLLALLFGLVTGAAEVAVRGAARLAGRPDPLVSAHFVWMAPLACAALFVLVIAPVAIVASELVDVSDSAWAQGTLQQAREDLERLRDGGTSPW